MPSTTTEELKQPVLDFCLTSFPSPGVFEIKFNKPKTYNALSREFWDKFDLLLNWISQNKLISVVIISSTSKNFCSGLDIKLFASLNKPKKYQDTARISLDLISNVKKMQIPIHNISKIPQPVIMSIDGACIGGGIDIICAGDIRICTKNAKFSIKEVDLGLVADVGTMSRIHKIVGNESLLRELCYTGRFFNAQEALSLGLVSRVCDSRSELDKETLNLAKTLASKSQVGIRGIKELCNYALDHSVEELNNYVAVWNGSMLQTKDIAESAMAFFQKRKPKYSKL